MGCICRVWPEDVPVWRVVGCICRVWPEDVPVWRVVGCVCGVWPEDGPVSRVSQGLCSGEGAIRTPESRTTALGEGPSR